MNKAKSFIFLMIVILLCKSMVFVDVTYSRDKNENSSNNNPVIIKLPHPGYDSDTSIEKALLRRRSVRDYKDKPLKLDEVSQLLWAAQGITDRRGFRTSPSAGALYPLEVYIVAGNVTNLHNGIYKYNPRKNELERVEKGDRRDELCKAALGQPYVIKAALVVVFSAVYERTKARYGERGIRYVYMEAGHAAQNVYLQAEALGLGVVATGAFYDDAVKKVMKMPDSESPLYIIPVGKK